VGSETGQGPVFFAPVDELKMLLLRSRKTPSIFRDVAQNSRKEVMEKTIARLQYTPDYQ
jgi:hypothetical protein